MDPIELCKRGSDEIVAYACSKCGTVVGSARQHGDAAREVAATHCGPWICRVCGVEHDWSHQTICHDCWAKSRAEREAERDAKCFATATKLSAAEYDGWVSDGDEGFWSSVEDAIDHYDGEDLDCPEWLWACRRVPLHADADGVIEHALEDHYEDAADQIDDTDVARLQVALDAWCESIGIESWETDYSRAVRLPEVER